MSKQSKISRFFGAAAPTPPAAALVPAAQPQPPRAQAASSVEARTPGAQAPLGPAASRRGQPSPSEALHDEPVLVEDGEGFNLSEFAFGTQGSAPPSAPPAGKAKRGGSQLEPATSAAAAPSKRGRWGGARSSPAPAREARDEDPEERDVEREEDADVEQQADHDPYAPDRALGDGEVAPGDRLGRADSVPTVAAVAAQLGIAQLTPLERQVVALKAKHPGCVLLFEVGYRYSLFGEDAALAAALLDIWAYRKQHFTTASVPTHRLDVHLGRLLQAGLRVGVVDQAETAARKKAGVGSSARSGTFERVVSALYTCGTYVPSSDVDALASSNQIVCLFEPEAAQGTAQGAGAGAAGSVRLSLVALDTFSNSLLFDSFEDGPLRSELHARLSSLRPVELLVPSRTAGPAPAGPAGGDARSAPSRGKQQQQQSAAAEELCLSRETAMAVRFYCDCAPEGSRTPSSVAASAAAMAAGGQRRARIELIPRHRFDLGSALLLLAEAGAGGAGPSARVGAASGPGVGGAKASHGAAAQGSAASRKGKASAREPSGNDTLRSERALPAMGDSACAVARAAALPAGAGMALGAMAAHLSSLVGEETCASQLRIALSAGSAGAGLGNGESNGEGMCARWADVAACELGPELLADLGVFDATASAAHEPGGASGAGSSQVPSLFAHLNRTHTQPGARLLKQWLRCPLRDGVQLELRLDAVGELVQALQDAGGEARAANGRGGWRKGAGGSAPGSGSAGLFARVAAAAAGGPRAQSLAPAAAPVDVLALAHAVGAAPCLDVERALARLASRRCSPPELWQLLATLEGLLAALVAGVILPELPAPDAAAAATTDTVPPQSRLLAQLVGDAAFAPAAVRARDQALLLLVRGWIACVSSEAMLANDLSKIFELRPPNCAGGGGACGGGGGGEEATSLDAELFEMLEVREQIAQLEWQLEHEALPAARALLRRPALTFKKVLADEYLLEVPTAAAKAVPADWERVCSTKAQVRFRPPAVARLVGELLVLREELALLAERAFRALCEEVAARTAEVRELVQRMATLDVLLAFARCASAHGYTRPSVLRARAPGEAEPPAQLRLRGARHPTAELHMPAGRSFVPNDVHLVRADASLEGSSAAPAPGASTDGQGTQCALLFGPNSGGKSLYARTALTLALLAQAGCWLPCDSAELTPFDGLYTRIGSHDRILSGESSFMVELSQAAHILARAGPRSLLLFDELGRGTSTHDGTAIAHATLEHVLTRLSSLCIFISHYPLLAQLEHAHPTRVACHHMSFVEHDAAEGAPADGCADRAGRSVTMLFKLARGKLERSFGINVARMAKLPDEVLREAARRSEALEKLVTHRRLLGAIGRAFEPQQDLHAQLHRLRTLQTEAQEAIERGAA